MTSNPTHKNGDSDCEFAMETTPLRALLGDFSHRACRDPTCMVGQGARHTYSSQIDTGPPPEAQNWPNSHLNWMQCVNPTPQSGRSIGVAKTT